MNEIFVEGNFEKADFESVARTYENYFADTDIEIHHLESDIDKEKVQEIRDYADHDLDVSCLVYTIVEEKPNLEDYAFTCINGEITCLLP